jgi:hypothetical protein
MLKKDEREKKKKKKKKKHLRSLRGGEKTKKEGKKKKKRKVGKNKATIFGWCMMIHPAGWRGEMKTLKIKNEKKKKKKKKVARANLTTVCSPNTTSLLALCATLRGVPDTNPPSTAAARHTWSRPAESDTICVAGTAGPVVPSMARVVTLDVASVPTPAARHCSDPPARAQRWPVVTTAVTRLACAARPGDDAAQGAGAAASTTARASSVTAARLLFPPADPLFFIVFVLKSAIFNFFAVCVF